MPDLKYDIALNYSTASADASLASFRSRALSQLTELSTRFSKIDLLKNLLGDADKAAAPIAETKKRVEELAAALKQAKDSGFVGIGKSIAADLRLANQELKQLQTVSALTTEKIKALDAELKAAGVDTKKLTAEQKALTNALLDAQKAAAAQGARQTLGITGAVEAKAQIDRLKDAYTTLKASGLATTKELEQAQIALNQKIREVEASTRASTGATQSFTAATLALAASVGLLAVNVKDAAKAAIDYEQGIARISSITTLSKTQLAELGQETLRLTTRVGIDAPTAFKALYEIISSGVPTDNALTVLEQSAKAAVAGVTDINTASRIGVAVLNAYGQQVAELPRVYDILFQTVKDGVITFPELSEKLGQVLPAARSAGVSLEEVSGSLVVLTRNGLSAPRAVTALEGALKQLSAPGDEARATMVELGISFNGLQGTIEQIAKKNLGPDVLRRLIPDVEGQRAVGILARQYGLLAESVEGAKNSAGAAQDAFKKLENTPQQQIEKFTAAMTRLKIEVGEALTDRIVQSLPGLTRLLEILSEGENRLGAFGFALDATVGRLEASSVRIANLVPGLGSLSLTAKNASPIIQEFGSKLEAAGIKSGTARYELGETERKFIDLGKAAEASAALTVKAAGAYSAALSPVATQINLAVSAINTKIAETEANLKTFADRLGAVSGAARTLFDTQNAQIAQQLQQQIAEAEQAIAKREITEQQGFIRIGKLRQEAIAADIANLKAFAAAALEQFDKEAAARVALAKKSGADVVKVELELRDARIKLLSEFQAKYAGYVLDLANQEKAITTNLRAEQDARRALVQEAERSVRAIYRDGLDSYQKRADIQREAEENLSKLRQALAQNDIKAAQQYYERVKQLGAEAIGTLTEQEKKSTTAILVRSDAQRQLNAATELLKQPIESNIKALDELGKEYVDLKEQAVGAAVDISAKLNEVRAEQSKAIPLRVEADSAALDKEINRLDKLLSERKPLVEIQVKVEQALSDAQKLKDDIEKNKPQVVVEASFEKLKADTQVALDALPAANIAVDQTKVNQAITDISGKLDSLFAVRRDLKTNADEVARNLAEINNLKFDEKTLTIKVKYVPENQLPGVQASPQVPLAIPGFSRGGAVPRYGPFGSARNMAIAHFASGGFVGRVPGVGNRDSEFRFLRSGSFVLRKDAVKAALDARALPGRQMLPGRSLLDERTLPGSGVFAGGVEGTAVSGDLAGLVAALNDAPIFDRSNAMSKMFDAALRLQEKSIKELREVFPLGYVEPGAEAFSRSLAEPKIAKVKEQYFRARSSNDQAGAQKATESSISIAQGIATPARGLSFDDLKDFAEAAAADQAEGKARNAARNAGMSFEEYLKMISEQEAQKRKEEEAKKPPPAKKAIGGAIGGGPLVPALLMPGEHVFSPAEVAQIGLSRLQRLNGSFTPKQVHQAMRIQRFAEGGIVDGVGAGFNDWVSDSNARVSAAQLVTNNNRGGDTTFNNGGNTFNFTNNSEQFSEAYVRNKIVPTLDEIMRKRGKKL